MVEIYKELQKELLEKAEVETNPMRKQALLYLAMVAENEAEYQSSGGDFDWSDEFSEEF